MSWPVARRAGIAPFIVMDVMRAANERALGGARVLHLEVGQPSVPPPSPVIDAARDALAAGRLGYTEALGLPELRQRIGRHYADTYNLEVDWRRIAVTNGSSGAFLLAFLAAFDVGERVAVTEPGYPAYRNILSALGIEIANLPVDGQTRYQPSPDMVEGIVGQLHGLVIASPANPTGCMLDRSSLRRIAAACEARGVRLISDEIYHGICYQERAVSALEVSNVAIVINSFSKYYAMTGWRLGWMVLPEDLVRPIERLAQNLFISPPTLSQYAALHAFDCIAELDGHVARYARNRALLTQGLERARFRHVAPADGAFYAYVELAPEDEDSPKLARRMLEQIDVAVTPGVDFDPERGGRHLRFCFAGATEEIEEAVRRLTAWR